MADFPKDDRETRPSDEIPTVSLDPRTRPLAKGIGDEAETAGAPASARDDDARIAAVQPMPRIEGYRLIRLLGQGGMGSVFEAEQENPRRRVAIKVVRGGGTGKSELRRFRREAHILGRLDHPGIARVYEAGTFQSHEEELPYYAMEYIEGESLLAHARKHDLGSRARLELLRDLCMAVGHAHASGVVHRDLKPGNVLVEPGGRPRVLDFGLARSEGLAGEDGAATLTETGNLVGTFLYMSPEQVAGRRDLDARSDVFALGTIAYELLTGRHPFKREESSLHDVLRAIREDDPTPLSATERHLRGDIETIVHKAMERERHRRYANASAMADDIERFLRDEPIVARAPSAFYQLSKFARRNRALVGGVAAVIVTLAAGLVLTAWQASVATRNARRAEASAALAESEQYLAAIRSADALIANGRHALAEDTLLRTPPRLRQWEWGRLARMARPEGLRGALRSGIVKEAYAAFDASGERMLSLPLEEGIGVWDLAQGELARSFSSGGPGERFTIDPRSERVVYWSENGRRRVIEDLRTGARTELPELELVSDVAFGPDGDLYSVSRSGSEFVMERMRADRSIRWTRSFEGDAVQSLVISPVGELLAFLVYRNVDGGRLMGRLEGRSALDGSLRFRSQEWSELPKVVAFSPDGAMLALGGAYRHLHVFDARQLLPESGEGSVASPIFEISLHPGTITRIAWSPDSRFAYSGDNQGWVARWNVEAREPDYLVRANLGSIETLRHAPRAPRVLIGGGDRTLAILSAETGVEERRIVGHDGEILDASFDAAGTRIVSAGGDSTARVWTARGDDATPELDGHHARIDEIATDARGERILTMSFHETPEDESKWTRDRTAVLWDARTGVRHSIHHDAGDGAAISPDGSRIVVAGRERNIAAFDVETGAEIVRRNDHPAGGLRASPLYSPGGTWIAQGHCHPGTGGTRLIVRRAEDLEPVLEVDPMPGRMMSLAFAPDDSRLYCTMKDSFEAIDLRASPPARRDFDVYPLGKIAVCPRTGRLAFTDARGMLVLDDPEGEPILSRLVEDPATCRGAFTSAFSPDGRVLAAAFRFGAIRIFDAATLEPLASLRGCISDVEGLSFNSDGTRLLSSENYGFVKLWDVESGRELLNMEGLRLARFLPNGRTVVAAGEGSDERVRRAYLLTSFPWRTAARSDAEGVASMQAAQRADYLRAREGSRSPSLVPVPRPNAGPPLFEDDFETTESILRWNMVEEGEWLLDGEATCRTERTGIFAASVLQMNAELPERYAFEADVRLPEPVFDGVPSFRAPGGGRVAQKTEGSVSARAMFLLDAQWKGRSPLPEGEAFGIHRFHVRGLRGDKPMYVADGRRWVFARFPAEIRESVMGRPSGDAAPRPLREVGWDPRASFRMRAEVEPGRLRVFLDGEFLYERETIVGPTAPPALLHYLDTIGSASYDRVVVHALGEDPEVPNVSAGENSTEPAGATEGSGTEG